MKHYLLFTFILFVSGIFAQTPPQGFNYSSVIRADDNQAIPNTYVSVRLSIIYDNPDGSIVYQEIHSDTTNQFGVLNLTIGEGTPTIGDFTDIAWEDGNHYLQTELDEDAGSDFEIMGIAQFLSVPYALLSGNSMDSPTKLSELDNDVGYITNSNDSDSDPTNELQVLSISNDTIFLSNGGFAKLPPAYSGTNTDNQILSYQSGMLSISNGNSISVPALGNDITLDKTVASGNVNLLNVPDGWTPVPHDSSDDTLELQIVVNNPTETFLVYASYNMEYSGYGEISKSQVRIINSSGQTEQSQMIDAESHTLGVKNVACASTAVFTGLPAGSYTVRLMDYIESNSPTGTKHYMGSRHILVRRL